MKIKRFVAKDIRQALKMVKDELGADAVIMSNRSVDEGVEIVAARDFDENAIHENLDKQDERGAKIESSRKDTALTDFETEKNDLHVISSKRKIGVDGSIPPRPRPKPTDQYLGYAEKTNFVKQPRPATKKETKLNKSRATEKVSSQFNRQPLRQEADNTLSNQFMQEMRDEMSALKSMLDKKLDTAPTHSEAISNPVRKMLIQHLSQIGLSKKLISKIANRLDSHENKELAIEKAREMLEKIFPICDRDLFQNGGVYALVGPTGVGKTTTVAKLAAQFILQYSSHDIALITTDNYRIGAHEQLLTYGQLLNIPVEIAANAEELRWHIEQFRHKRLILIDTAGMSQHDMRLADQIHTLQQENISIKTLLVMSAATQYKATLDIINAFKIFNPESGILTKLDETASEGSIISAIIENQLPVSFITNGQQVPEDIVMADNYSLIEHCLAHADEDDEFNDDLSFEDKLAAGYG